MFATFMEVLDTTVVNVSLPHIAGSLSATIDEATWALTSYLVANAIILPMTGWLASRFGRKRLIMLVGRRIHRLVVPVRPGAEPADADLCSAALQGATGGAMQPLSQAVLLEAFPPHDRGKAMGFWGLGIVVAPILGPVLGGWLTDNYSWRWVFYINIPVGIASLVMTRLFVFDPAYIRQEARRIDYWGIGMLAVGIGALQFVLDKGQEDDWFSSRLITTLAILSAVTLVTLVVHELRTEDPVVDLRVFKERSYAVGVFPDDGHGLRPLRQPGAPADHAADAARVSADAGRDRDGAARHRLVFHDADHRPHDRAVRPAEAAEPRLPDWRVHAALAVAFESPGRVLGHLLAATDPGREPLAVVRAADHRVDGRDPREKMGNATSLFNLMRNIGGSIGIADDRHDARAAAAGGHDAPRIARQRLRPGEPGDVREDPRRVHRRGADPVTATNRTYAALFGTVWRQASMVSFVTIFQILGLLFIALIPLVLIMKRPPHQAAPPPGVH